MLSFEPLLDKYLTDSLSETEQKEFNIMLASGQYSNELKNYIDTKAGSITGDDPDLMEASYQALKAKIKAYEVGSGSAPVVSITRKSNLFRVAAAAVIVLLLSVVGYIYFNKS